jgi:sulfatase modifying factor 1
MNLTSQTLINQKIKHAESLFFQSIQPSSSRLRLKEDRRVLNGKKKRFKAKSFKVKNVSFDMILCQSGIFTMGSDKIHDSPESNPKRIEMVAHPFLLGETEVTQELYQAVMRYNPSKFKKNGSKKPVESVTWYEAVMFCNKLSEMLGKMPYYHISDITFDPQDKKMINSAIVQINPNANGFRLPTEKEWEYAAKAGTNNKYAGCDNETDLECYGWYYKNSNNLTQPVKTRLPNEWGFYDMTGNVWEWCWDKYDNIPTYRVNRGGNWDWMFWSLRSASHGGHSPGERHDFLGFRLAASLGTTR